MDYIYGCVDPGNIDYTGLDSDTANVIVDNNARTIKVEVHDDVGFDIRKTLPKDADGNYLDGEYKLTAVVLKGIPSFVWTSSTTSSIRYGVTDADTITESVLKDLTDGGPMQQENKFSFSQLKQRTVFAYPKTYGKLSGIIDGGTGLPVLSGFEAEGIDEVSFNDVIYYVYKSGKSTGNYTYTFSL